LEDPCEGPSEEQAEVEHLRSEDAVYIGRRIVGIGMEMIALGRKIARTRKRKYRARVSAV
jgi:hypothetical protein